MLQDRSRSEADLIYAVACLDNDERLAIRMSYKILFEEDPQHQQKVNNKATS